MEVTAVSAVRKTTVVEEWDGPIVSDDVSLWVAGWVRWQRQLQYPPLGFKNKSTVAIRYFRRITHLSVGDETVSVIFIARFSS